VRRLGRVGGDFRLGASNLSGESGFATRHVRQPSLERGHLQLFVHVGIEQPRLLPLDLGELALEMVDL